MGAGSPSRRATKTFWFWSLKFVQVGTFFAFFRISSAFFGFPHSSWLFPSICFDFSRFFFDFSSIWGRFWLSKPVPKRGPRNLFWKYFLVLGGSGGQDGPKTFPETSQDRFWYILNPSRDLPRQIFLDFGPQLNGF